MLLLLFEFNLLTRRRADSRTTTVRDHHTANVPQVCSHQHTMRFPRAGRQRVARSRVGTGMLADTLITNAMDQHQDNARECRSRPAVRSATSRSTALNIGAPKSVQEESIRPAPRSALHHQSSALGCRAALPAVTRAVTRESSFHCLHALGGCLDAPKRRRLSDGESQSLRSRGPLLAREARAGRGRRRAPTESRPSWRMCTRAGGEADAARRLGTSPRSPT